MDYKNPDFWIAMAVGGSLVAILSTIQQFTKKDTEEGVRYRAIFRDFCIGAFLSSIIYMFVPDSVSQFLSFSSSTLSSIKIGGSSTPSSLSEIELQTGPARF